VQALAEVHETPKKALYTAVAGVDWTFQEVPFQRSARGFEPVVPTAMQLVTVVQATALSTGSRPPVTEGRTWTVQLVPFQDSAKGWSSPELSVYFPSAMQNVDVTHFTELS